MSEAEKYLEQLEAQNAQTGLTGAYLNPETPEQTAKRFQKARLFELSPTQVETVTPEEEAVRKAQSVDYAAMYAMAPVLTERLSEPAFANLVKDDLSNASFMESMIWRMAPETGERDTVWGAVRNAFTRGGYAGLSIMPAIGPQNELEALAKELQKIESIEQDIADGKDVSARFATAEDPTGQIGLRAFGIDKERIKAGLVSRMGEASQRIARLQQMQAYFPAPKEVQDFMQAEGLGDSLRQFAKHPLMIAADVGVSSLTQQAPALLALPLTGGLGLAAQAGTMGAMSFGIDRNASMQQNLQEDLDIDLTDPDQIVKAFLDPTKRAVIARAADRANRHALATAAFDAASVGLASKVLLPKSIVQKLTDDAFKKEFANLATQSVAQGAMGGMGEAAGQYLSDGEISSWSDIVAEVIGEQFTAPIEVMTTGMKVRHELALAQERAKRNAEAAQQLEQAIGQSQINQLDPETMSNHIQRVAKSSGVETVSIDAQALQQTGLARRLSDIPEVAEQLEQMAQTGGDVTMPMSTYVQKVLPNDQDGAIASISRFGDTESLAEAVASAKAAQEAMIGQANRAAVLTTPSFRTELADLGREIGAMIRHAGVDREEAKGLQAIIQTQVGNLAQSLGVSPKAVWNTYGARILGEPSVQRDAQGNLTRIEDQAVGTANSFAMGSPLWDGDLLSFIKNGKEFGRYQSVEKLSEPVSAFLGNIDSVRLQVTRNQLRHAKKAHPELTDEQLNSIPEFLTKATGGYVQPDGKVVLFKPEGEGYLLGVFEAAPSSRRAREGEPTLQLNYYNSYFVSENTFRSQIKKKQAEHPGTGGELPSKPTFVGSLNQPAHLEEAEHPVLGGEPPAFAPTSHGYNQPSSDDSVSQLSANADLSKGDYFPSLKLVARWKNANRSTLLHETAHMFLDMRFRALNDLLVSGAPLSAQQRRFQENMMQVLRWFGVKSLDQWNGMTLDQQRPYHEKFARSFEAYVMQGKAPVDGLKAAFRAFKRWLIDAYRVIANIPGAELNEDVTAMFDAMFLADEQVREATMRQGTRSIFNSPEEAGMDEATWAEYNQALADSISDAKAEQTTRNAREQATLVRMRRRAMRELKGEAKGRLAEIRKAVEKKVKQSSVYKAWDVLRNGKSYEDYDVKIKLYVGDLEQLGYTKREINQLYEAKLATKRRARQPLSIAQLADGMGFANANEMVDELLKYRDMDQAINDIAAEQFLEKHPELANDDRMNELANASVFNDARAKVVDMELRALERMGRQQSRQTREVFEELAYNAVAQMRINDCKPITFVRLANRAARNARQAFLEGRTADAIKFKRQELYQTCMAKEAKESMMELNKGKSKFKDYRKREIKAMDTRFLTAIQRALATMGFYTEKRLGLNPTERSFSQELDALSDETGQGFDVPHELVLALNAHDLNGISTIGGFRSFLDFIGQLDAKGRREKLVDTVEGKLELDAVQTDTAQSILSNADAHHREEQVRFEGQGSGEYARNFLRRFGLNHFRASSICAVLDGAWDGKLTKLLIYPSDEANNREATFRHQFTKRIIELSQPIRKSLRGTKRRTSRTLGVPFTTSEVFYALLNYGNEGNRQRMLSTIKYRTKGKVDPYAGYDISDPAQKELADAQADSIMSAFFAEYLTPEHYKVAEGIWKVFADMQVETDRVARKMTGRSPVWVQARPVTVMTADGPRQLSGGYYPIRYDRQGLQGYKIQTLDSVKDLMPIFADSGVSDGHLQSRVGMYDKLLSLTSRALFEGLDDQIHYIAWAEFVKNAQKLLDSKGAIAQAIQSRYGADWLEALNAWVQACRNGNRGQTALTDDIANVLRRNVSLAGIGLNLVTAMLQFTGYTQSITYLGGKWAARGMGDFLKLGGRAKALAWVGQKSTMMQDRARTQFRELAEAQSRLNGNTGALMDKIQQAAYMPITYMQMMVDLPTWIGAYEKALAEGQTEKLAVAYADRAVMNSQGSGRISDLSTYERGGAWAKLFTVFYTFFNTVLNNAIVSGMTKTKLKAAGDMLMLLVAQPVIESFLRAGVSEMLGTSGDDDDDWAEKALKDAGMNTLEFNLGLFVGVRELMYVASEFGYGYQGPAGLRKIGDTGKAITAIGKAIENGEVNQSTVKAMVSGLGVWTGIPVTPINRAISGGMALYEGETDSPWVIVSGYSSR